MLSLEDLSALILAHQASLRAFVRALGAEADWVDDLAQEVFLVACQKLEGLPEDKEFGKFLRGIARKIVANECRKSRRRKRIMHESISQRLLDCPSSAEDADTCNETLAAMRACLAALPEPARWMLQQRYTEEASSARIAERLGRTSAAVRQALLRCRELVRKCLEKKLGEGWA